MGAVHLVARCELRRRWRRVAFLAVIVGLVGAVTLATAAGARRTSSALDRFKASSRAADLELEAEATPAQVDELRHLPGVAALAALDAFGVIIPADPNFQETGVPRDGELGTTVDRDRLVSGRAADPAAPDEATIGEGLAGQLGLRAGDRLDVQTWTPPQIAAFLSLDPNVGPPAGPTIPLHVVGIVRRPLDLGDQGASGGLLVLTPAFARTYADHVGVFGSRIRIRTVAGAAGVGPVLAAARGVLGDSLLSAETLAVGTQGARSAIDLLASALWVCLVVTALAGIVVIAVVTARELHVMGSEHARLREIGFTRRQLVAVSLVPTAVAAVAGALFAVVVAVAASPRFPLGVARRADPDVGVHMDWPVAAAGLAALIVGVLAVATVASVRATGRHRRSGAPPVSPLVERIAAGGVTPPVSNGVRMALERAGDGAVAPLRPAVLGGIIGVLGVTAALLFGASVDRLLSDPPRYGTTWDFSTSDGTASTPCGGDDYGLSGVAGIATLVELCTQNVAVDGRLVTGFAYSSRGTTTIGPVITEGRAPREPNEAALGAATLRALGKHVGDVVDARGRTATVEYRVVGVALFPTLAQSQPLADGAAFTGAGYAPLYDQNLYSRFFLGRYAPGTDRRAVAARIDAIPELTPPSGPVVPVEVDRLGQIDWLPALLAILIAGLALLAVGHALVTAVRRRRRELALLRTLGFTPSQVRASVAWQATTLAVVGLAVGLPVGTLAGALIWRHVAGGIGVTTGAAVPLVAMAAVVPGAVLLLNAVAFVPARSAARARPAVALRAE